MRQGGHTYHPTQAAGKDTHIWQCSQCLPGPSACAAAPPITAGLYDIAVHSPLGAGTSHQGRLTVPTGNRKAGQGWGTTGGPDCSAHCRFVQLHL